MRTGPYAKHAAEESDNIPPAVGFLDWNDFVLYHSVFCNNDRSRITNAQTDIAVAKMYVLMTTF